MAIQRIPTSSVFASLVLLLVAASCAGNSTGGGSREDAGEGGESPNPTGSGGSGNRGGSANAGQGGAAGKGGSGAASSGSGGEGAAAAGGAAGGDAGAMGSGGAGEAGEGFGGESGGTAGSEADAGGSGGTHEVAGGTTGNVGGAGGHAGGTPGDVGGAGGEDAGGGGEGGASSCNHEAVIIAQGERAWGLSLDASHVYFTERTLDGAVRRVSKEGGSVETISENEAFPSAIAVSGERVFWSVVGTGTGSGRMIEGAIRGGSRSVRFDEPEHGIFALVADEHALYYTTYYNVLKRVALEDGATSEVSGGPFNSFIVDLALDDAELYWTNDGVGHFAPTEPESAAVHAGPTQLVSRLSFPLFEIAVADGSVYFNDDEAIHRAGVAGGPTSVVVALPPAPRYEESPIADLAADGQSVFFADRHAVYRVPTSGGAPTTVTDGWAGIEKLLVDEDYLYFTDNERGAVVRVQKCAVSGGPVSTNAVEALQPVAVETPECSGEPGPHGCPEPEVIETIESPYGLALDATHVYYSTYGEPGSIRREALAGGDELVIAAGEVRAHDIAVTDEYVLWSLLDIAPGRLAKAPKTGGARVPLATGVGNYGVGRVTSDGTFAYYITGFNGIYRVALAGGPSSIIAAGPFGSNAVDVAHFGGELFWANDGLWNANFTAKLPHTAYTAKAHVAGSTTLSGFTLEAPLDYPLHRIAVDANAVYFIDDALLYRVSRSGGEVNELGSIAPASGVIVDLETDGQNLYFADLTAVYRMPVTGGDVVTMTSGWAGLRSLAVNANSLYFTDFAGGAVLRMPK